MASIRKRKDSYTIIVSTGRTVDGVQIREYMTWKPDPGMTAKQIEKELTRIAVDFERQVEQGYTADDKQTFAKYADYVIALKERTGTKHKTIVLWRGLLDRIIPVIGNVKIKDLRPQHLNGLYERLEKEGVRRGGDRASAKADIIQLLKSKHVTQAALSTAAGVSVTTIRKAVKGNAVSPECARKMAVGLSAKVEDLFEITLDKTPLSKSSVIHFHRFISTVLSQATKELLLPFNVAANATPPKPEKKKANYFQPQTVEAIRDALELEPLKWKVATHLLLITGSRRGETVGIKWPKIIWDKNMVCIDCQLLYTADAGIYEESTKNTSSERYIKLPAETMALLKEYRKWWLEQRMACGDKWVQTDYLFTQWNGRPMHPDSLTAWHTKFSKKYGLPHINPHAFRHTHASLLYFNHVDSISISKRLGHARVSTTTDIYSHIIQQADAQAAECIADVILRKSGTNKDKK